MRAQKERERQLRVEKAKEAEKGLEDQLAFRRRLRGAMSLFSGNFQGFPESNNKLG